MSHKLFVGEAPARSHVAQLRAAPWPATRGELIDFAACNGAPLQLLEELFALPDDDAVYDGLEVVLSRPRRAEA